MHKAELAYSSGHPMLSLINISSCIPMTNMCKKRRKKREKKGAMWRVDDCFTHGCVFCYWMCRSDVSGIPFRMCLFFIIVFGLVVMDFLPFLACGRSVFLVRWSVELSVGYWTWIGSSSDHMIILAVRRRSWRKMDSWSFGGGLFWVLFNIFLINLSEKQFFSTNSTNMQSYETYLFINTQLMKWASTKEKELLR